MKCLIFLLLFLVSGCATTDTEVPQAQSEQAESNQAQSKKAQSKKAQSKKAASTKTKNPIVSADGSRVVCFREKQVGSHFSRKVCKTTRQMQAERKAAAELLDRSRAHDASQNRGEQ